MRMRLLRLKGRVRRMREYQCCSVCVAAAGGG